MGGVSAGGQHRERSLWGGLPREDAEESEQTAPTAPPIHHCSYNHGTQPLNWHGVLFSAE